MFKFSLFSCLLVTSAFLLIPIAEHRIEAPPFLKAIPKVKKKAVKTITIGGQAQRKPAVTGGLLEALRSKGAFKR